jgi:hypothetical protein
MKVQRGLTIRCGCLSAKERDPWNSQAGGTPAQVINAPAKLRPSHHQSGIRAKIRP